MIKTSEELYQFFAHFEAQMIAKGRKGPARSAERMKKRYALEKRKISAATEIR